MAIYLNQYDPYEGIREGLMAMVLGINRENEKQGQSGQLQKLLAALPGLQEKQTLFPVDLQQPGGAPVQATGTGISPSGGVGPGTPAAPAIVEQVPQDFDLNKVMSSITDPNLALQLLPTMMNYDQDAKRMQSAQKIADAKMAFEAAQEASKPVKITAWKQRDGKYIPVQLTVKQAQVPDVEARLQEKGYFVGETPKDIPRGPETWTVVRDANGRFVQRSSTGKVDDYPGQGGSGSEGKDLENNAKRIRGIKEAITAELRPYQQQSTDAFSMTPPDDAYQALKKAAFDRKNPDQKKAQDRLRRVNRLLNQVKQLGAGGESGAAAGNLTKNADGTYTFSE